MVYDLLSVFVRTPRGVRGIGLASSSWNRFGNIHLSKAGRAGGAAGCGCSRPAEARAGAGRGHPLPAANGARTAEAHADNVANVAAKHGRAKRGRVQGLPPEAAPTDPPSGGADGGAYGECPCDRARRGWWRGSPVGAGGAVRTADRAGCPQTVGEVAKTARDTPTGTHGKRYPFGGCNTQNISALGTDSTTKKPL